MDGGAASVGTSIKAFRTRLWLEKLGLCMCSEHEKLIEDPVVDAVYRDIWLATARSKWNRVHFGLLTHTHPHENIFCREHDHF